MILSLGRIFYLVSLIGLIGLQLLEFRAELLDASVAPGDLFGLNVGITETVRYQTGIKIHFVRKNFFGFVTSFPFLTRVHCFDPILLTRPVFLLKKPFLSGLFIHIASVAIF